MVSNYKIVRPIIFGMPNILKGNTFPKMVGMALYAAIVPWTMVIPPFYGLISFVLMFLFHYNKDPLGFVHPNSTSVNLVEPTNNGGGVMENPWFRTFLITLATNWVPLFLLYLTLLAIINFRLR